MTISSSERRIQIETHGVDVIGEAERKGHTRSLFWPWCSANMSVLFVSWGAYLLDFGLSLRQCLIMSLIGVIASFFLVGITALAGPKGSAPTLVLSRASFGLKGNVVPGVVSWLLLIGWEIFGTTMAVLTAGSVAEVLVPGSGNIAQIVMLILVALVVVGLGIIGFDLIMKAQKWFTIATLIMTVGYIALTLPHLHLDVASQRPDGGAAGVIGAFVMLLAGFGVGWTNCAADYSRYLPRTASKSGIVGWTTIGGSLPVLVLVIYGTLLCASNPELISDISRDPIGPLVQLLPVWFLIPFGLVAISGFVASAVIDIYSSGLNLVALGLPIKRWTGAAIDGVIMIIGTIAVVWFAPDFLTPFMGFLITLAVPLSAWSGIFLADLLLRRKRYDEARLFSLDRPGSYRSVRWDSVIIMVVASVIGFGLVTNSNAEWLTWQGFLLDLGLGGREGPWAYANLGVLVALALSFVVSMLTSRAEVRAQELV